MTLLAIAALAGYAALAQGLVPVRFNPLRPPDLSDANAWFLDARLSRLRYDRAACRRTLSPPEIEASPISDSTIRDGCGWTNAVRTREFGAARLPITAVSCEMAAALAMWIEHVVQVAAAAHFQSRVVAVQNFGGYSCRNIIGNNLWRNHRSQHATANALDISAFTLSDGRKISVKAHWAGDGAEARFLRDAHRGACRYFRVVLGPDYNEAHRDHFHFDRGYFQSCK